MCHSAIALRGAQANSSNVHGRLWLGRTAPEPTPSKSVQPRIAPAEPEIAQYPGRCLPSGLPRNIRGDRTPWLDCEEKSATIAPAV